MTANHQASSSSSIPVNAIVDQIMQSTSNSRSNNSTSNFNNANQLLPLNTLTTISGLNNNIPSGKSSKDLNSITTVNGSNNCQNGLLDLIMCKLAAPFHVVKDPRLLDCGSTACYQCIISTKDQDRNLKCPYCNDIHKIDSNRLLINKNLNNFLKFNLRQINQNFSKQLEDSMFALEQKIHSQNLTIENFDQYLTLVQNDVQMKIDTFKSHLEKYGEQFIDNLKTMRKDVQKKYQTCCKDYESRFNVYRQWIEHSTTGGSSGSAMGTNGSNQLSTINLINGDTLVNLNNIQTEHSLNTNNNNQLSKDGNNNKFQIIGIKADSLLPANLNALTVNAANCINGINHHNTYQLNSSFQNNSNNTSSGQHQAINNANQSHLISNSNNSTANSSNINDKQRNTNTLLNSSNKLNVLQQNETSTTSLDVLIQNPFNFSNSSSWNTNDDDLDDSDADIGLKQPLQSNATPSSQKRHLNKEQAQFNKFVREEVSKKFGEDFLLQHEVNQLEISIMESIKTEAIASFLPKDTTPIRAWKLAKVSLRSLKRDLRRKQGLIHKKGTNSNQYYNI